NRNVIMLRVFIDDEIFIRCIREQACFSDIETAVCLFHILTHEPAYIQFIFFICAEFLIVVCRIDIIPIIITADFKPAAVDGRKTIIDAGRNVRKEAWEAVRFVQFIVGIKPCDSLSGWLDVYFHIQVFEYLFIPCTAEMISLSAVNDSFAVSTLTESSWISMFVTGEWTCSSAPFSRARRLNMRILFSEKSMPASGS